MLCLQEAHWHAQDWSLNYLLANCQLKYNAAKPFALALSLLPFLSPSVLQTSGLHLLLYFTEILHKLLYVQIKASWDLSKPHPLQCQCKAGGAHILPGLLPQH